MKKNFFITTLMIPGKVSFAQTLPNSFTGGNYSNVKGPKLYLGIAPGIQKKSKNHLHF